MIKKLKEWLNRPSRYERLEARMQQIIDEHKAFVESLDDEELAYYRLICQEDSMNAIVRLESRIRKLENGQPARFG